MPRNNVCGTCSSGISSEECKDGRSVGFWDCIKIEIGYKFLGSERRNMRGKEKKHESKSAKSKSRRGKSL